MEPAVRGQVGDVSGILADQADRLFREHASAERLAAADRGEWPDKLWRAIEDAGLPLALAPESAGGVGLDTPEAMRLVRRAAYHTLPIPLAETILANALWAEAGGASVIGPMTLAPVQVADRLTINRDADAAVLAGNARRVPWGARANHILVFAGDEHGRDHLVLVHRAHAASRMKGNRNLAYEPRDFIDFDGITVSGDDVRPAPVGLIDGFLPYGALLRAAQMTGAMERALDHALAYANERVQFGRPIGKFQAIQHMLAQGAGHYAAAAASAEAAAEAYGTPSFGLAVAVAKARCGEAAGQVAAVCHQVHAAMGFTQEHPLHFATRRLWSWRDEFGAEPFWQERIGRLVCGAGGEALWARLVGR